MRSWVHVWGTVVCMYAELGACLRSWVHVWGTILGLPAELGACLEAGCFPNPQAGPSPGPWPPPTTTLILELAESSARFCFDIQVHC